MLKRREKDGVKKTQAETVGWRGEIKKKYLCTGKQRQCYEGKQLKNQFLLIDLTAATKYLETKWHLFERNTATKKLCQVLIDTVRG